MCPREPPVRARIQTPVTQGPHPPQAWPAPPYHRCWPSHPLPTMVSRAKNISNASSNKARSPGWSRNLEANSELYPRTNAKREGKGPSQAGNSWAQLRGRMKSPLSPAPSFKRRPVYHRVLEGGQGLLQRAGTAGPHSVEKGWQRTRASCWEGAAPSPERCRNAPAALSTAGTQAKLPGSSLPSQRITLSRSTYCVWQAVRCVPQRCYRTVRELFRVKSPPFPACSEPATSSTEGSA